MVNVRNRIHNGVDTNGVYVSTYEENLKRLRITPKLLDVICKESMDMLRISRPIRIITLRDMRHNKRESEWNW